MSGCCLSTALAVFDTFVCLFVVFPLAVFHWRGTWNLLDVYIYPDNPLISNWISFGIGSGSAVIGYLLQPVIERALEKVPRWQHAFVSRLYIYIFGWAILCYWRGLWNLVDYYFSEGWKNSLVCYITSQLLSFVTRTGRTNAGLPVQIQLDTDPEVIRPTTRFMINQFEKPCKYFLDVCFTQFVVVTLNVLVWRGIWNILDAFLFPSNHLVSDVASLAIGYLVLIGFFLIEYPASVGSSKLDKYPTIYKIIYEDIIFLIVTWGVLLVWRGGWDIVLKYVIPDHLIGGWVCHCIGSAGLILLQGLSNVGTNGIDLDGMYKNGEGVFPTKYLRSFLEDQLKPKVEFFAIQTELDSLISSDDDEEEASSDFGEELPIKGSVSYSKSRSEVILQGHDPEVTFEEGDDGKMPLLPV